MSDEAVILFLSGYILGAAVALACAYLHTSDKAAVTTPRESDAHG